MSLTTEERGRYEAVAYEDALHGRGYDPVRDPAFRHANNADIYVYDCGYRRGEEELQGASQDYDSEPGTGCAHEWVYTGTAYGGDDPRWSGEGRCYCRLCGADGDA